MPFARNSLTDKPQTVDASRKRTFSISPLPGPSGTQFMVVPYLETLSRNSYLRTGHRDCVLRREPNLRVGYARVSTADQSLDLQIKALEAAGVERVFVEKASGAQRERPELTRALDFMRSGDELVVWKLDRLGRSLRQLIDAVEGLAERGIELHSITEKLETGTPSGKLIFHVFGALAEWEKAIIRERTLAGLAAAKDAGKVGGRPRSLTDSDIDAAKALLANRTISVKDVAARLGVSLATLYRYLPAARAATTEA